MIRSSDIRETLLMVSKNSLSSLSNTANSLTTSHPIPHEKRDFDLIQTICIHLKGQVYSHFCQLKREFDGSFVCRWMFIAIHRAGFPFASTQWIGTTHKESFIRWWCFHSKTCKSVWYPWPPHSYFIHLSHPLGHKTAEIQRERV